MIKTFTWSVTSSSFRSHNHEINCRLRRRNLNIFILHNSLFLNFFILINSFREHFNPLIHLLLFVIANLTFPFMKINPGLFDYIAHELFLNITLVKIIYRLCYTLTLYKLHLTLLIFLEIYIILGFFLVKCI